MKKILFIVALFVMSCASHQKMVGTFYVKQVDPFIIGYLGPDEGTLYRVLAPKELEKQLRKLHLKRVVVEYTRLYSTTEGETINILSAKEVKE